MWIKTFLPKISKALMIFIYSYTRMGVGIFFKGVYLLRIQYYEFRKKKSFFFFGWYLLTLEFIMFAVGGSVV